MNTQTRHNRTFPHGFLDFLTIQREGRHRVGGHLLEQAGLDRFNTALRELTPQAPQLTFEQIAAAAERALQRHRDGSTPSFVVSRLVALDRLEAMSADAGWNADAQVHRVVEILRAYREDANDLIPDALAVVGLLDDAVLIDVGLQLLHGELGDYDDFCRFRKVAAEFSGLTEAQTGLNRQQWLEAVLQAHQSLHPAAASPARYAADPRTSLFHIG